MEKAINKLSQWFGDENEILDELAHEVATAETMDEMVKAKTVYQVQATKVDTIIEAIKLVKSEVSLSEMEQK
jgi:hypothetical protein